MISDLLRQIEASWKKQLRRPGANEIDAWITAGKDPWEFLQRWRASLPEDFKGLADAEVDSWRDKSIEGRRETSQDE